MIGGFENNKNVNKLVNKKATYTSIYFFKNSTFKQKKHPL